MRKVCAGKTFGSWKEIRKFPRKYIHDTGELIPSLCTSNTEIFLRPPAWQLRQALFYDHAQPSISGTNLIWNLI